MCGASAPKTQPARRAAQAADPAISGQRAASDQRRRFGFQSTILTGLNTMGAATTTGKTLLGA